MLDIAFTVIIVFVALAEIHGNPLPDEGDTDGKNILTNLFGGDVNEDKEDLPESCLLVNQEEEVEDSVPAAASRKSPTRQRRDDDNASRETEEDDCSDDSAECQKTKTSKTVTPSNELETEITYKLQRLGFYGGRTRRSHHDDDDDESESIALLNDMKKVINSAYSGVASEVKKRRKDMTPAQKEMLNIYQKQLKIATDFSISQIDEFIKKLKKGKNKKDDADKEDYADDGGEIIYSAVVNFDRQYDAIYNYMYDKK